MHEVWPWVALPIAFAMPFLMWGLNVVFKKKGTSGHSSVGSAN